MENRLKLTVNISPTLFKSMKLEAVNNDMSYSDSVCNRIKQLIDKIDTENPEKVRKKYQHAGIINKRGRPTGEFIEAHGPILKKKATFYIDKSLRNKINKTVRKIGFSVSDLVELALKTDTISEFLKSCI
jgi:hypothetical protein